VRRSVLLTLVLLLLVVGGAVACSSDDDGSSDGDGAQPASEAPDEGDGDDADDEAFCAEVERQLETATGDDLIEAYAAIEAIAEGAPEDLQDVFEQNLVALEPVARAADDDEARDVFVEEVAPNEEYTESLAEIGDAISDRCDVDLDAAG
jgi:hypothetical protein